jgi:ketosteroid isomerase-like protein
MDTMTSMTALLKTVSKRDKQIVAPEFIRLLLALAGFAVGLALPTFAQQKQTVEATVQERNLLGNATALGEVGALAMRQNEAFDENNPDAVAALFTEDAVLVAPDGIFLGRQAIEKRYQDTFKRSPFTLFSDPRERQLAAIDNAVWSIGEWWSTLQTEEGPAFVRGYWSAIYVHEGDTLKIRMLTLSERNTPDLTRLGDATRDLRFPRVCNAATL